MRRPPSCNCRCSCCLSRYTELGTWYPQRWSVDAGSWSWSLPSGLTQYDLDGPLSPAVETQIHSQEFHALTVAHPLTGLGADMTAWSMHEDKYGAAFGTIPVTTPYGATASSFPPDFRWLCVDDTSIAQWWHDAYAVVRNSAGYELISVPAALISEIVPLVDRSDNTSGAVPWRDYDTDEIETLGADYAGCFVEDMRIGAAGYDIPWGIGDECNEDVEWQSGAATFGNSIELSALTDGNGQCWWYATVRIKPRFSVWSNGLLSRAEYYRAGSAPDPLTLHANGYIRNGVSTPGLQTQYSGKFGFVHPAIPLETGYQSSEFADRGWTVPPYLIPSYGSIGTNPFRWNDTTRNPNNAGPGNESLVTSNPPGGWRCWIVVYYRSALPINCRRDLEDGDSITLELVDSDVGVNGWGLPPDTGSGIIPWSDWLGFMSDAWGLSTPPSTITVQRLEDLT